MEQEGRQYVPGGIKFVSLSPAEEQTIQEKLLEVGPARDTFAVAGMMMESLKKNGCCIVQTG